MHTILLGGRGSRPIGASEGSPFQEHGGDTTSTMISCKDGTIVVLDAGSAFWKVPYTLQDLMGRGNAHEVNLFISHFHADHTMGLAQSELLFNPNNEINIYGPNFGPGLITVFNSIANRPANPDLSKFYNANTALNTLMERDGTTVKLSDDVTVTWMTVQHGTEEALGFRVNEKSTGESVVCISDTNHDLAADGKTPIIDPAIVDFIHGANVMIYDCHFSDEEIKSNPGLYLGMGHSSGEHGVRLCEAAGVPILIQHHHNPQKTDSAIGKMRSTFRSYGRPRGVEVIASKPSIVLDTSLPTKDLIRDAHAQITAKSRWKRIKAIP